jgi:RNA polymerase sigma-70 factor (ECF subfamily)
MAWLITVVRRSAIERLRQHGAERFSDGPTPEDDEAAVELEAALLRGARGEGLRMLHAEERRALLLVYFEGLTHEELAMRLGIPLGTAKSRVRRGLLRMKDWMAR